MIYKIAAVTLLGILPSSVQAGNLRAKFVDQDNKPVIKVRSKLVLKESGKEFFGKTNKKGEAEFEKIDPGEYQLWGQAQGYMPNRSAWLEIGAQDSSVTLTLVGEQYYRKEESNGNQALTEGKFSEAVNHYETLVALVPQEGVLWANLAKAHVGAQEPQKATEAAKKAAELDPSQYSGLEKQVRGWVSLEEGRLALQNRDFQKAVAALTDALSIDSSNPDAYYALALAYGHQQKYPEALKNIEEALRLKPNDPGFLEVKRILTHNAAITEN